MDSSFNDIPSLKISALVSAIVVIALFITSPVLAKKRIAGPDTFPTFDIEASCAGIGDQASCVQIETEARDNLQSVWSGLSAEVRRQCVKAANTQRGSYVAAWGRANAR